MQIKNSKNERGFSVLIVLMLLALMIAFVTANSKALYDLKREIKNVDKRQQLRWQHLNAAVTNAPPK